MIDREGSKKLGINSLTAGMLQLVTIACGFIVPRMILGAYGSEVNGLVNSIAQFLMVVSFMEMGIGAVVQSALYKPLADNDKEKISGILKSTQRFFRVIALVLFAYILALLYIYPFFVSDRFDATFTALLILAIGLCYVFQYYIGMPERLLLLADQRGYIQYVSQIIVLIVNTIVSYILIKASMHIYMVKFVSALVFLIRPVCLKLYVDKHYCINKKIRYDAEPINQKWNGVAQHLAAVILDQTDVVVLTVLSTLSNVSIYSVYHLVVFGIKCLFLSFAGGIQPLMGEYIAKEEKSKMESLFDWTEWVMHSGTTLIFTITGTLLVPFVQVYTKGINDTEYTTPVFAALLTVANAGHCLRLPYNITILAAGHYKQTQHNYIIAAVMNVLISVMAVKRWGLIGVAVGTVAAMMYQTIWMSYYDSKNIVNYPVSRFWKHCCVDVITALIAIMISWPLSMRNVSYVSWIVLAIQKAIICISVALVVNLLFYKDKMEWIKTRVISKTRLK